MVEATCALARVHHRWALRLRVAALLLTAARPARDPSLGHGCHSTASRRHSLQVVDSHLLLHAVSPASCMQSMHAS
eukprot:5808387-Amphidinium_carterae.1